MKKTIALFLFAFFAFQLQSQIRPYYPDLISLAEEESFPLRERLINDINLSGPGTLEIAVAPHSASAYFLEQLFIPILSDNSSIQLKIYPLFHSSQKPNSDYFSTEQNVEEAKRQYVIQTFFYDKLYDYLMLRASSTVIMDSEIIFDWRSALQEIGIDISLFDEKSNLDKTIQDFQIYQESAQLFFNEGEIISSESYSIYWKGSAFLLEGEDFITPGDPIQGENYCCDFVDCWSACLSFPTVGDFTDFIESIVQGSISPFVLAERLLNIIVCKQTCLSNPCAHGHGPGQNNDIGLCGLSPGSFCYKFAELLLNIPRPPISPPSIIVNRAECGSCPQITFSNTASPEPDNNNPVISTINVSIDAPKANSTIVLGINLLNPPIEYNYIKSKNGTIISNEEVSTDKPFSESIDLSDLVPGEQFCVSIEPTSPPEFVEGCPKVEKCFFYSCPDLQQPSYDPVEDKFDFPFTQNEGGAKFTQIRIIANCIDANGNILHSTTSKVASGSWPLDPNLVFHRADLITDCGSAVESVCFYVYVEPYHPNGAPGNRTICYDEKKYCFPIYQPICGNLIIKSVDCDYAEKIFSVKAFNGSGDMNYTYVWDNNTTSRFLSNVIPNKKYCVTVTDSQTGCTASACFKMTKENCCGKTEKRYDAAKKPTNCIDVDFTVIPPSIPSGPNYPDGEIQVLVTGVPGPYDFFWEDLDEPLTTGIRQNLKEGTYCVEVSPANGSICCFIKKCVEIKSDFCVQNPLILQVSTTPACNGDNGTAYVEILNNNSPPPYSFIWSPAGPWLPFGNEFLSIAPFCNLSEMAYGAYQVTVTDGNGCQSTTQAKIDGIDPNSDWLTIYDYKIEPAANCNGGDGAIYQTLYSSMPLTFQWSNGAITQNIENLDPGYYSVTISGICGNEQIRHYTVPSMTLFSNISLQNTSTAGACDGSMSINIQEGQPPFVIAVFKDGNLIQAFSGNSFSYSLSGLCSGVYNIEITDSNGCSGTQIVSINTCEDIFYLNPEISNAFGLCSEYPATGIIDFSNAQNIGGTPPYSFEWSNGDTGPIIYNLRAGAYQVTITDSKGCKGKGSFSVGSGTGFQKLTLLSQVDDINHTCSGSISVHVYQEYGDAWLQLQTKNGIIIENRFLDYWSNNPIVPIDLIITFEDLCSGDYIITLSEASLNGYRCFTKIEANVGGCNFELPDTPVINRPSNCTTPDGTIQYSANPNFENGTPPFLWSWRNGQMNTTQITGLSSGVYELTIYDSKGCSIERIFDLSVPSDAMNVAINNISQPNPADACNGSITINGLPGTKLILKNSVGEQVQIATMDNNTYNFSNLCSDSYTIEVEDNIGCPSMLSFSLVGCAEIKMPTPFITLPSDCNSNNGSIIFSKRFGHPKGGTPPYILTLENENGTVFYPTPNDFYFIYEYLPEGNYKLIVEDALGCVLELSYEFPSSATPFITLVNIKEECEDLLNGAIYVAIEMAAQGNILFTLTGNGNTWTSSDWIGVFEGLETGNYHLSVVNEQSGCKSEMDLFVPELLSTGPFEVTVTSQKSCPYQNTGELQFNVQGGNTPYYINVIGPKFLSVYIESSNYIMPNLPPGNYLYKVTDYCGRTIEEQIEIEQYPEMNFTSTSVTDCPGHSALNLTVTGGTGPFNFNWTGPNGFKSQSEDLTGLFEGNYMVTVTDDNGCFQTYSRIVSEIKPPAVNVSINIPVACPSYNIGKITLNGGLNGISGGKPPYSFVWSNGSTTSMIQNLPPGQYYLSVTDGCGTFRYGPYTINQESAREIPEPFSCFNLIWCGNEKVDHRFPGVSSSNSNLPDDCSARIYCENNQTIYIDGNLSNPQITGGSCEGCNRTANCTIPSPYIDRIMFNRYDGQYISDSRSIPINPNTGQITEIVDFTSETKHCGPPCTTEEILIKQFCNGEKVCDDCIENEDIDGDCVKDAEDDNCPGFYNPGPTQDVNGFCTSGTDSDGDKVPDSKDNCPDWFNPTQKLANGGACGQRNTNGDPINFMDADGDDIPDGVDNCPNTFNLFQEDLDGDGKGDACDNDFAGKCFTCSNALNDDISDRNNSNAYSAFETTRRITIIPNPFSSNFLLYSDIPFKDQFEIEIISAAGIKVFHKEYFLPTAQDQLEVLVGGKLPAGVYQITVTFENGKKLNTRGVKAN